MSDNQQEQEDNINTTKAQQNVLDAAVAWLEKVYLQDKQQPITERLAHATEEYIRVVNAYWADQQKKTAEVQSDPNWKNA